MLGDTIVANSFLIILVILAVLSLDRYEKESIGALAKVFFLPLLRSLYGKIPREWALD